MRVINPGGREEDLRLANGCPSCENEVSRARMFFEEIRDLDDPKVNEWEAIKITSFINPCKAWLVCDASLYFERSRPKFVIGRIRINMIIVRCDPPYVDVSQAEGEESENSLRDYYPPATAGDFLSSSMAMKRITPEKLSSLTGLEIKVIEEITQNKRLIDREIADKLAVVYPSAPKTLLRIQRKHQFYLRHRIDMPRDLFEVLAFPVRCLFGLRPPKPEPVAQL